MTLHLPTFFAYARRAPFGGRLSQSQVEGLELVLDCWNTTPSPRDDRHLAYILATAFHETGARMQPVREGFAKTEAGARRAVANRRYAKEYDGRVYYGRGLVQLTWISNYRKMGEALGLDLVADPDLALDPDVSVRILIEGMTNGHTGVGDFTKKSVEDYFNATTDDPEGARRVVNGTDKASLIAGYHRAFLDAIKAGRKAGEKANGVAAGLLPASQAPAAPPHVPDGADLKKDPVVIGGLLTGAGALGGMVTYAKPVLESINSPWAFGFAVVIALGLFLVLTGRVQIKRVGGV